MVNYLPEGYNVVTPYLTVKDAAGAIDFYARAFGATERMRLAMPNGQIGHAELLLDGAVIFLADENLDWNNRSPRTLGGSPVGIHVYVENVDAVFAQALAAGATSLSAVSDKFYGDRSGCLRDPYGHTWHIATHVEDVTPEEMDRRMATVACG